MPGAEDAVVTLFRARGTALARYAYLLTGDEQEAEDLVQDAIVRVLAKKGGRIEPAALEAYVRTTVLNRVVDEARRRERWWRLAPRVLHPRATESPEQSVADASEARALLRVLSPRQRACVVLRFYEDEPVAGIAALLGMSEGTVKRHLSDAVARLRAAMAPVPEGGDDVRTP